MKDMALLYWLLECSLYGNYYEFRNAGLASNNKYVIYFKLNYDLKHIVKGSASGSILCSLLDLHSPPETYGPYTEVLKTIIKI